MSSALAYPDAVPVLFVWGRTRNSMRGLIDEEYDFKFVDAFQNLENMGADWDHMNEIGRQKVMRPSPLASERFT